MKGKKLCLLVAGIMSALSLTTPTLAVNGSTTVYNPEFDIASNSDEAIASVSITISEYEMIASLAQIPTDDLLSAGYTREEISDIKNYKQLFTKQIEELDQLETETLLKLGYTASQINDIRNFTGDEAQIARLAANVSIYASINYLRYDGDYTRGVLAYSWSWDGVPDFKLMDIVAISWNHWVVEDNRSTVNYVHYASGEYYNSLPATLSFGENENKVEVSGAAHKFIMQQDTNLYYARSGNGSFTIRSDVHAKKDIYFYIAYGHTQLLMSSPTFTVGTGGADGSISFSIGTSTVASYTGSGICP